MSDIYSQLGVQKIINATGTFTVLGGSRMSDKTLEDMKTAASNFVQIKDLQKKIIPPLLYNQGRDRKTQCCGF